MKPAILVIVGKGQAGGGLQQNVCVEGLGEDVGRSNRAIGLAEDESDAHSVSLQDRQSLFRVMLEARRGILLALRQSDPGLNAIDGCAASHELGARARNG